MKLNQLIIPARLRSSWQAIDLGFVLARHWYLTLWLGWIVPAIIIFISLTLIFWALPWVAITVVWWLKPFWDRVPQLIISQAIFQQKISLKQLFKQLPQLYAKHSLSWLTFRRFSFSRSVILPVVLLEGLKGSSYRQRVDVLTSDNASHSFMLTSFMLCFECLLFVGILSIIQVMMPSASTENHLIWEASQHTSLWTNHLMHAIAFICFSMIAPFYNCCGFMLYINRRIHIEAWDIDIQFKNMAQRHQQLTQTDPQQQSNQPHQIDVTSEKRKQKLAADSNTVNVIPPLLLILSLGIAVLGTGISNTADAQSDNPHQQQQASAERQYINSTHETIQQDIEKILDHKDFGYKESAETWQRKNTSSTDESDTDQWLEWLINFLEKLFDNSTGNDSNSNSLDTLFTVIKFIFIAALISFIFWICYLILKHRERKGGYRHREAKHNNKPDQQPPSELFGLDLTANNITGDSAEKAKKLALNNDINAAIRLLYSATLVRLMKEKNLVFRKGHTETECADITSQQCSARLSNYVQSLTLTWQTHAYAHSPPSVAQLVALCDNWEGAFHEH